METDDDADDQSQNDDGDDQSSLSSRLRQQVRALEHDLDKISGTIDSPRLHALRRDLVELRHLVHDVSVGADEEKTVGDEIIGDEHSELGNGGVDVDVALPEAREETIHHEQEVLNCCREGDWRKLETVLRAMDGDLSVLSTYVDEEYGVRLTSIVSLMSYERCRSPH